MTSQLTPSPTKPMMNGMDAEPTSGGFRHQLPQIAVMSRNPKIAQSKTSVKEVMSVETKSTTDVEGVGKVVHIGSELMEIDDAEKSLLEQLENSIAENEENVDTSNKSGMINVSEKSDNPVLKPDLKDNVPESLDSKTSESTSDCIETNDSDTKGDSIKGDSAQSAEKQDTDNQTTEQTAGAKSAKSRRSVPSTEKPKRKTRVSEAATSETPSSTAIETTQAKPASAASDSKNVKGRRTRSIDPVKPDLDTSAIAAQEPGSPTNKRQRKPKKLDLDAEPVTSPTQKTPKEKPVKPKFEVTPGLEEKYPVQYMVGDLVWSKVSGHPWWPCMISYDPFTAQYTRLLNKRRDYHVQFFGNAAERGWIAMNNLLEFKGRAQFDEYVKELFSKCTGKKELQRLKKWYNVPPSRVIAVNIGIDAAELALALSRNERRQQYTFVYKIPQSKLKDAAPTPAELAEDVKIIKAAEKSKKTPDSPKPAKKRKQDEMASPETDTAASKRRKVETPKCESPSKASKKSSVKKSAADKDASFEVFCQKEKSNALKDHPEFTEEQLMDFCRQQWCMMSQKQKARYKSKFSEDHAESPVSPSRKRKPTKKVLEAEESNKVLDEVLSTSKKPATPGTGSKGKKAATPSDRKAKLVKQIAQATESDLTDKADAKSAKKRKSRPNSQDSTKEEKNEAETKEKAMPEVQESSLKTSTLIPAKRGRPQKSVSVESDSQSEKQSESGRSTPSPMPDSQPVKRVKEEYEYVMEIHKLSSAGPQKKENLCQICEQTGELIECTGPCQGYFHTDCLGIPTAVTSETAATFKCDECQTGNHTCFACKKMDLTTQRCSVPVCGKFYHMDCVKELPQAKVEGKSITCPLHNCHTCIANNLKASAAKSNGRLLRCVRCPTAYHVGDYCISAGSINLTGFNIVCAKHFQPLASQKHHSHINVGWCFICNKGGTLLCCESCPAAYHSDCLKIDTPTGSWYCSDCKQGKRPLYGEIIWVKLGNYRWWPGEICHPRHVPVNIQEKAHQVGEFPVHFLGSHDFFWLHQGRVFSFQEGDKGNTNFNSSKGLAKQFGQGLQEAADAFKILKEFKDNREQQEIERESKKPPPFRMVKANVPLGSVTIKKVDLSQIPRCECKSDQEHPCGKDSDCLNHMMMYECHSALCNAGEKCENQFFTKRQYPQQQSYKTEGRGWGLMALDDIKKGQFVNEYVGDLIDEEECKKRLRKAHVDDITNYYMMTLDQDRIIDAGPKGNHSRFMNHSCDPNLETQKWTVNGDVRVGLFALRDINKGEELTFNYNFDCLGNEQTKCCCGSDNCSGYLGVRPKTQGSNGGDLKKKEAKMNKLKKKKKVNVKLKHDDDCFRCGEGGELMMCDRSSCPKSYHLHCLGLDKPPYGKWDCPWHHCDECGKPALQKCVECPNSFCGQHATGNTQTFDGKMYCLDHEDLLQTLAESQTVTTSDEISDAEQEKPGADISKTVNKDTNKPEQASKGGAKDESVQRKKRGSKAALTSDKANGKAGDKSGKLVNGNVGKTGKGKKAGKGAGLSKELSDDLAYVAPMFDDSEDEEFGLVIDIPNF